MNRFWDKVEKTDSCWVWRAAVRREGYGVFLLDGKLEYAHRVAWYLTHGRWPTQLDHLCKSKLCVRPDHLEEVTTSQNNRRKFGTDTHCRNGHPRSVGVTRYGDCRQCRRDSNLARRRKVTAAS